MLAQAGFTTPEVRPRHGVNSPLAPPYEEVTGTPPEISVFSHTCFPACCVRKFQTHAGPIGVDEQVDVDLKKLLEEMRGKKGPQEIE